MSLATSTYRSGNNPRAGVDLSTPRERSHVASRSWEWLKQSLWQGCLVGTICTLAGRSLFLWPSHPVIALGCGLAACAIIVLNRNQISQMRHDFEGLNGFTKVLAIGIPIIVGVTAPALIGYALNISLKECFISIPLSAFSAGLSFFKAKDDAIDIFFLCRSRRYKGRDFNARFYQEFSRRSLIELQQPRNKDTYHNSMSSREAVDSSESPIIEEVI
ncbi:MAG: hypothetical protein ACRDAI_04730 [Candidatus Rhabdochlamydia sp.]